MVSGYSTGLQIVRVLLYAHEFSDYTGISEAGSHNRTMSVDSLYLSRNREKHYRIGVREEEVHQQEN